MMFSKPQMLDMLNWLRSRVEDAKGEECEAYEACNTLIDEVLEMGE